MSDTPKPGATLEELQPDYENISKRPKTLTKNRHIDGVLYVAGRRPVEGQEQYDIMFLTSAVEEDEAVEQVISSFGFRLHQPAEYLKGGTGVLKDVALRAGIDLDKCYYTACCKWLLPRTQRTRPPKKIMNWGMPVLEDEIARVKPKIIVCLGKHVYDMIAPQKISFNDAHGCWFWSEKYQAHLYVMHAPYTLVTKPEFYETFRVDFKEVARRRDMLEAGDEIAEPDYSYQVIRDQESLEDWLSHIEELVEEDRWPGHRDEKGNPLLAVDCEWHGKTHVDANLRTIQFAWSEKQAVVIEFRNERNEWSFELNDGDLPFEGFIPGVPIRESTGVAVANPKALCKVTVVEDEPPPPEPGNALSEKSRIDVALKGIGENFKKASHNYVGRSATASERAKLREECQRVIQDRLPSDYSCEVTPGESVDKLLFTIRPATSPDAGVAQHLQSADDMADWRCVQRIMGYDEKLDSEKLPSNEVIERFRYKSVGLPIARTLSRIKARFIGHHFAADAPMMEHWLGIDTYGKCELDTEFAQQTVDESSELKLERGIAMRYTTLGRYDQLLVLWKRENRKLCEGGYGFVPSDILNPYAALDVITPYRAYPLIKRQLEAQQLWTYYRDIFNPFVTDVFTEFCVTGLPMDIPTMDALRELFAFSVKRLSAELQRRITREAQEGLLGRALGDLGLDGLVAVKAAVDTRNAEEVRNVVKKLLHQADKMADVAEWNALITHWETAPDFNIRSPDQLRRWLFGVEKLTPVKTTNQKAKGLPSMAWEKVQELPPDRQALYTPAVDKQTLQILSDKLPTLNELLHLNAVGNLAKAFFKEAEVFTINEETGEEEVIEHGLHAWVASDGRIHGQMSTTETSRSRSWAPNTLNFPAYVNKMVAHSVHKCVHEAHEEGSLPESLTRWVGKEPKDLPSVRACIKAPEGWIFVESDYQTAEMVG
jgi:uracil-DNA glycosylase family 4